MQTYLSQNPSNHHVVTLDKPMAKSENRQESGLLTKTVSFLHRACQALPSPRTLFFTTTGLLTLAAGAAFGRSLIDRQTGLQGLDNEGGILGRDIPNILGANSRDHFVPEPFGSGTYPFDTFPPQLPDFTQTQASDWIAYEPDRVKDTTLPMLDDPKVESEAAEALNNLFSEKAAPIPLSTDSLNSDTIIEKDENIQQEDQSSHSRRKRFVGDIIIPGSSSSAVIVEVRSVSETPSEIRTESCTGSIVSKEHILTAAHCNADSADKMTVMYRDKEYKVREIDYQYDDLAKLLGHGSKKDLSMLTLESPLPDDATRLDIDLSPLEDIIKLNLERNPPTHDQHYEAIGKTCHDHIKDLRNQSSLVPDFMTVGRGGSGFDCKNFDGIPRRGFFSTTYTFHKGEAKSLSECNLEHLSDVIIEGKNHNARSEQLKAYQKCLTEYTCEIKAEITHLPYRNIYKYCEGDSGGPLLHYAMCEFY